MTLTYGVRADIPTFPDKPTANPLHGFRVGPGHGRSAERRAVVAARGLQLRLQRKRPRSRSAAGSGSSPGGRRTCGCRTSTATPASSSARSDRRLQHQQPDPVRARCQRPADDRVGGAATNEIDLIDPDYKYPSLVRTNFAYDRELGFFGLVGTTEFLYSSNVNDVRYENLNLFQTGTVRTVARSMPGTASPGSAT